ncbi:MAG: nucleoside deaminase [Pirellulales bacterium]|nr:nucleoside deaminase [Pirellulales bacterium]
MKTIGDEPGTHERYMQRCIELARTALQRGNVPVGSIVVLEGSIVGEGFETLPASNDILGHAEVIACGDAVARTGSKSLVGASLYSTAEPCFMCSYLIREYEIGQVVYAIDSPGIGGATSNHPILTDVSIANWGPAPNIVAGILREECQLLRSSTTRQ